MRTLNEQIRRLRDVLVTCYNAIKRKGGTIPEAGERNMTNLPAAVLSIPQTAGVLKELEVTADGVYLPAEHDADGFSKVTAKFYDENATPFEYKEVTFIDHLGVVADYTIEEAMALSVLPTPREYTHLTFDEWSMTLDEIQDGKPHTIAANYHTTNNEYRFGYTTEAGKKLIFSVYAEGPCLVDFGNGDTTTTSSVNAVEYTYNEDGEYNVVVNCLNGLIKEIFFTNDGGTARPV